MVYVTGHGAKFSFTGFAPGNDPLSNFDAYRYEECLHGVTVLVYLFIPYEFHYQYLADDGLIHELIHLIQGIDICTHNSLNNIRQQIKDLLRVYSEAELYLQKEAEPV